MKYEPPTFGPLLLQQLRESSYANGQATQNFQYDLQAQLPETLRRRLHVVKHIGTPLVLHPSHTGWTIFLGVVHGFVKALNAQG